MSLSDIEWVGSKIVTTFKCDICGAPGTGWKRGSIRIHHNGIIRSAPIAKKYKLCAKHFETFEPYDINMDYDSCDDDLKRWWDR